MKAEEAAMLARKNELDSLVNSIGMAVGRGAKCASVSHITFRENEEKLREWGYKISRFAGHCDMFSFIPSCIYIEWD